MRNMHFMKGVGNGDYRWIVLAWDRGRFDKHCDAMANRQTELVSG